MAKSIKKQSNDEMDMNSRNALECGVCRNRFSDDYSPRLLPCTHSVCVCCIERIIATGNKICPYCRHNFKVSTAEDLTLNRNLLEVAKHVSDLELCQKAIVDSRPSRHARKSFKDFKEDFRNNFTKTVISKYKDSESKIIEAVDRLEGMWDTLDSVNSINSRIILMLSEMETNNRNIQDFINAKVSKLKDKIQEVLQEEEKFKCADERLQAADDFTSTGTILDECKSLFDNAHEKLGEIQESFPKTEKEIEDLVRGWIKMHRKLKYIQELIGQKIDDDFSKMYAVDTVAGVKRMAPLRLGLKYTLSLSKQLQEEVSPKTKNFIELESLMNKTSRRVFLDLGADGRLLGRMIIKVRDDGCLANNFLHMCSGALGQSYVHSPVFALENQGKAGENVCLGKYLEWPEREGEPMSRPVLKEVNWAQESRRAIYKDMFIRKGDVRGFFTRSMVSQFRIFLRNDQKPRRDYIGSVEEGLTVLSDAIMIYRDYESIRIINCGLIFDE